MFYAFMWGFIRLVFYPLGLKVQGLHNIPAKGAVIVAANHVSNWDPIVVAAAFNRPIHFMAKAEIFKYPIFANFFRKLNAFPVKRGAADKAAIKEAMHLLESNNVVGIFPEGTRNKTGEDLKPQLGVAMIALKTGTPILPVACLGTNVFFPLGWFKPLEVRIGELIYLEEYNEKKVNSQLMAEVSDLVSDNINQLFN